MADLEDHLRFGFGFSRTVPDWPVRRSASWTEVSVLPPSGSVLASDGECLRRLALDGIGLARLNRFHVDADIAARRLVPVLEHLNPGDTERPMPCTCDRAARFRLGSGR